MLLVKLADVTWPEVESLSRETVVVVPTGSLEQHGTHLPLFTDSLIVTSVATAVESTIPGKILLVPTLWLGASGHHLAFAGSLSASFEAYISAILDIVGSLTPHGFRKFFLLNGHGGNTSPNDLAVRKIKALDPTLTVASAGYFAFCENAIAEVATGPLKVMRHACEAETSLMLHLYPGLVRLDRAQNDGLITEPSLRAVVHHFDEMTEKGSFGYAPLGTAEKGKTIFDAAVLGLTEELDALATGYVLRGLQPSV